MKKFGIIAMAIVLLMGMSQCKKEKTETPSNEGVKVPITLNVNGGHGSRVAVNTENGEVTFENNDVLYVASDGVYVGTLTYNGTNFSGDVTEPTEGQKLHFYFLGNVDTEEALTEGTSTGCSVVISDQTEHLPVISYAPSRENYQVGKTDYNATLLNKCALVKFNVTTASESATCILGMNNKVAVDFTDNSFDYSQEDESVIILPAGNGEKWAILLPQDQMSFPRTCSLDGIYVGVCGTIPGIDENDYLTDGLSISINTPKGALNGFFTVNDNGDQVYFSQGNLQYNMTTNEWSFMEHQYDIVETCGQEVGENYANQNIVSLFGWGTSGYNHGATFYQPWCTGSTIGSGGGYAAYGGDTYNLFDQTGQADWGYNPIVNGGNTENSGWRTMTIEEWDYIFNIRTTASGIRYVGALVNGVTGVILLPDNWSSSIYVLNINGEEYSSNTITVEDWANTLEPNGAVFLPAAGNREWDYIGECDLGYYWSASRKTLEAYFQFPGRYAFFVFFDDYGILTGLSLPRAQGASVRLVRNVE